MESGVPPRPVGKDRGALFPDPNPVGRDRNFRRQGAKIFEPDQSRDQTKIICAHYPGQDPRSLKEGS